MSFGLLFTHSSEVFLWFYMLCHIFELVIHWFYHIFGMNESINNQPSCQCCGDSLMLIWWTKIKRMVQSSKSRLLIFISNLSHSLNQTVQNFTCIMANNCIRIKFAKFSNKLSKHLNFSVKTLEVFLVKRSKRFQMKSFLNLVVFWWFKFNLILLAISVRNAVNMILIKTSCIWEKLPSLYLWRYSRFDA